MADVKHFDGAFLDREQDPIRAPLLSVEQLANGFSKASFSGARAQRSGWVRRVSMVLSNLSSHRLAAAGDLL